VLVRLLRPGPLVYAIAMAGALAACGSGSPAGPSDPGGPPVNTNVITITASGASPRNIQVALGSRVRFVNNDSRPHWMASDPHPEHDDCPEFDPIGTLLPGQTRETANLVQPMTCGFHDHDSPNVMSLTGQVTIR
jgi:plastocyanin